MRVPGRATPSPLMRLHVSVDVMIARHAGPAGMPLPDGRMIGATPIPWLTGLGGEAFAPWQLGATV